MPIGYDLDQYRTQAKELLKLARAADPAAIERIRTHHPEHDFVATRASIKLADVQLVLARELGFASWAKLKEEIVFRKAVHLVDTGQLAALDALLDEHPSVLTYRCHIGEWYESGYFAGATLLNHIAGNPIRHPLPKNIVDVTRLLLSHGADPNIATDSGATTIGLILTGKQVSDDRIGVALIDVLTAAGAAFDADEPDLLSSPLWNCGRATAEELVARGAKMDLRHAAALGRIDVLERQLAGPVDPMLIEEALIYACMQGETEAAKRLIERGAKGDILIKSSSAIPAYAANASGLHIAAWYGRAEVVKLLLEKGAKPTVIEPTYNGTAIGWAEHGGHPEIAEMLKSPPRPSAT